ncbi:MAG TPA: methionine aminotransferase [Flavobacteriales bacterium]|nr:methionine aminotransferase [Flavobacteriales bacterium]
MPHFSGPIRSKLPKVETTIFTVMSQLAAKENAVNLSQGFPDFSCSPDLTELVNKYMKAGFNQYSHMAGFIGLRQIISDKVSKLYGAYYNPETEITVTAGGTQAIYTAIASTIGEGDEVILFTPAYDCFEPAIELNGGKPVFVQLSVPDYSVDWESVKKVINQKTKMIIINTPHNPSGTVLNHDDFEQLEKIVGNTDILVLCDEVYEHIVFDGLMHESITKFPNLAERSFVISSFGKTFHTTGWKVGYCLAPENLMKEFRKAHQFIVFAVNTPIQHAIAEFLQDEHSYMDLSSFYQQKRDLFLSMISPSRFKAIPSKGTYFQLLNFENITDKSDVDFSVELTKTKKIASIPVSVFYHKKVDAHVLRFCFAKSDETLRLAADIINSI